VVYQRDGAGPADTLHVYIEGDGRPWLYGVLAAVDPTPRDAYALRLMARDPAPAVYLGRPCYFGLHADDSCDERFWTAARYAPAVVDSMAAALERLLAEQGHPAAVLVGYSGGGALAVLLADKVSRVRRVVTIAANLDTDQWTARHGYLPLAESLNPMTSARLQGIAHVHFGGAGDAVVPGDMIRAFAERHGGRYRIVDGFDHRCCWHQRWPDLLSATAASPTISVGPAARAEIP
jgi:pimeloyl-ACP methyl ester carboxylesterase